MARRRVGLRACKQCKRLLPEAEFLDLRRRGWRVVKCSDCARENMAKWGRTRNVGMMPDAVREADE